MENGIDHFKKCMTLEEIEKAKEELSARITAELDEAAKTREYADPDKLMKTLSENNE